MSARPSSSLPQLATGASQYQQMRQAFGASGGIVTCADMLDSLARFTTQPISRLARWIVDDELLRFQWQGCMLLPLFQFDATGMAPDPSVTPIIRELLSTFREWDACLWFAEPNAWLGDALPVELLRKDARAVLDAARADRCVSDA
ncbi:MAG TPA: hypothetical protein VN680_02615 [Burkholderiaceae bacterium]|nr:hypothetical protein [Burkholderiaceae bacterium]